MPSFFTHSEKFVGSIYRPQEWIIAHNSVVNGRSYGVFSSEFEILKRFPFCLFHLKLIWRVYWLHVVHIFMILNFCQSGLFIISMRTGDFLVLKKNGFLPPARDISLKLPGIPGLYQKDLKEVIKLWNATRHKR